jgi:hypothetical protein
VNASSLPLGVTGNTWIEVVLTLSIVVPLAVLVGLAWFVLASRGNDPDEQRWRRLEEQRRGAGPDDG